MDRGLTKVQQVHVELRYSDACRAAWARISWGRPGDIARVMGRQGLRHPHLGRARLHGPRRGPTAHRTPESACPHHVTYG